MKKIFGMIILYVLLIALLIAIITGGISGIDQAVYQALHKYLDNDFLNLILSMLSAIFEPFNCLIMVLIILAILFFVNRAKFWLLGFWSFCVFLIGTIMKYAIERPRPSTHFDGYSFPSMHVLSVCLVVSLVILVTRSSWAKVIGVILIAGIIVSRIFVHAHYFSDTIGSLLVIGVMLLTLNHQHLNALSRNKNTEPETDTYIER
ncbi:phosphatase PAP2 family protein [Staphylococcus kloosii]|jgi:membrane-associated phospholipid phosphatase|uniref:Phosphatidic acid phosphatase type 2/haloperoxidase domain-containing protein n=1 Tax=Staphylococcus kloosii TaxID=29384 RepID=A0ABQ0XNK7_9STAP|nr:phosphatase PAP2 family protein [Staphylococcus kloosii]AVQ35131.1 PAP2 family protein [Staphylococcus kloosii]MBF7030341.1 phosphatase PAP2 family protein [Staphylococcus kloosii]PNZ08228.1 phosphatase PAP2 family protein [Staphylococcus kloosii]PTJ79841.1 PAP2 family protein [Staphylococcus kloosii]SUM48173.1 phospholipid phosphatase [Staphylococcus kloosii]